MVISTRGLSVSDFKDLYVKILSLKVSLAFFIFTLPPIFRYHPGIFIWDMLLLLLLLNRFSRFQLCATPETAAHQAPLSVGFSRQEYWSGLPGPLPGDLSDPGIEPAIPATPAL